MIQPGLDVQQAMKSTLASRPALNTLLGGAYVFDELPRGATAPYVVFTTIETRDWSVADQKAHENFVTLEIKSKSRSRMQVQNIIQEIETALDGATLTLAANNLINLRCIFISAALPKLRQQVSDERSKLNSPSVSAREKSNQLFTATMRFRAATEPKIME
jgi:hypothetical protein